MDTKAIVIVEDNEPIARLLQEVFNDEPGYGAVTVRDAGYRAVMAATIAEAAEALAHARVGLVLADARLPDVGGPAGDRWAAVARVKALAGGAPVVIVTADGGGEFADYAARGFAGLLPKPIDLDELVATARRHLPARGPARA